jgi:hypothetical protein
VKGPFTVVSRKVRESDRVINGESQWEGRWMMIPALVGVFATVAVLLSRCGLSFAVVTAGTALSGTILMLTL